MVIESPSGLRIREDWVIGDRHPVYGTVEMMGVTGGEAYRWFVDEEGVVSMVPLSFLLLDE